MTRVCPNCGSKNIIPIIYGFQTIKLNKQVERGEVDYGGHAFYEGMPNRKCRDCQATFAVRQRTRGVRSFRRPVSVFLLFVFVGCFAGNATIIADSVVFATFSPILSASMALPVPPIDIVLWFLGVLAVVGFLVLGIIKNSKMIVLSGLGYVAGFMLSAWLLNARWTMVIEAAILLVSLTAYAGLSKN
jgi:hypothetical protein